MKPPAHHSAFGAVLLLVASGLAVSQGWTQPFTVVNVIPSYQSRETNQNSEPNIGGNPRNPDQIIISAFGPNGLTLQPFFLSANRGTLWTNFLNLTNDDTTVAWGPSGEAYIVVNDSSANNSFDVLQSANPVGGVPFANNMGVGFHLPGNTDQPWVESFAAGGPDHVYVGFNNAGHRPGTAGVLVSTDGGAHWTTNYVDGGAIQTDGPPIRVAANGNRVYAVFERYTGRGANTNALGQGDRLSQVVVVRDDNGAAGLNNNFMALGASGTNITATFPINAANQITIPFSFYQGGVGSYGTLMGQQGLGADLSIAVDPTRPDRVFVAYAEVPAPFPGPYHSQLRVAASTDGGSHWALTALPLAQDTGLPALAVAQNGTVALLYTALNGTNLETHFVQSTNGFQTAPNPGDDAILARFTNGTPAWVFDPYIGDYQDLVALGTTFYGTFSASNDPKTNDFPQGVYFQRTVNMGGIVRSNFFLTADGTLAGAAPSIDPYFFCVPALGSTNTLTPTNGLPALAKWLQRPDISPTGLDILATLGTASPIVADDFMCTNTDSITDIYIWGSWRDDKFDPNATLTLSFWSDQPATNGQPSHPDTLLWTLDFGPNQPYPYTVSLDASCCTERFLDPTQPLSEGVDTRIYSYHFSVPTESAFLQTTGTIYWLSVSASGTTNLFGWKTCITNDHHFDDATFSGVITNQNAPWVDLHYPPVHPFAPRTLDMSFALLSKEIDYMAMSLAAVVIALPNGGTETVLLSGPTAIYANVGLAGETALVSTNGLDQVETEMIMLNLQGTSSLGPMNLVLRRPDRPPFLRSTGLITEQANTVPGRLDLPPFAAVGCGDSFFDVCFEVHLSNPALGNPVWHNDTPKHMDGTICSKPPGYPTDHQNTYYGFTAADLRDEAHRLVAFIIFSIHVPNPEPDVPVPLVPPEDRSATAGGPVTFSVTAAAVSQLGALEPVTYQWQRKGTNDTAFINIPGATNSTYTLNSVQLTNNGSQYQVVLGTAAGSTVISGPATLNVALPIELLVINRITASSGQAILTFQADSDRSYSILYRDTMATNVWPAGLWLTITNVPAWPSNRVVAIPDTPTGPERYYRLVTPAREP